ncbi:MAG: hypothetical protein EZS28_045736 [Streblomastix strix]|uniref:Uncharacterized protein n=1 Tax=Streblomastix strix TaxID=222440 RepID=A0A5J4TKG8_9EUKA|nr:MAG: hypothetical protein EZS28_045736 [Streblomastix strix]
MPQPLLIRLTLEQIQEKCATEEIDTQRKRTVEQKLSFIQHKRYETIGRILNYFAGKSNPKEDWYNAF